MVGYNYVQTTGIKLQKLPHILEDENVKFNDRDIFYDTF